MSPRARSRSPRCPRLAFIHARSDAATACQSGARIRPAMRSARSNDASARPHSPRSASSWPTRNATDVFQLTPLPTTVEAFGRRTSRSAGA